MKKKNETGEALTTTTNTLEDNKTEHEYIKEMKNEIKNNMLFPKHLKIRIYNPLHTLFLFAITLCVVSVVTVLGFYAYEYGVESILPSTYEDALEDRYDALIEDYDKMLVQYQELNNSISRNEAVITEMSNLLEDYSSQLDDYKIIVNDQSKIINALAEALDIDNIDDIDDIDSLDIDDAKNKDKKTTGGILENKSEDKFNIYCMTSAKETVEETLYSLGYEDLEDDFEIITYDYYEEGYFEEILADPDSVKYPDLIIIEPNYQAEILKNTDLLTSNDLDISDDVWENYSFGEKLGLKANKKSKKNNELQAFYYVLAPGYIQVRADLAEKYFGTTDPDEIYEEYFCDMETFIDTCEYISEESKGKVALISSTSEIETMLNNAIDYDDMTIEEVSEAVSDYVYDVDMWSGDWMDLLMGQLKKKEIVATLGTTWFSQYLSLDTVFDDNNMILVKAPIEFYWGGNGIVVPENCHNSDIAADIINALLTDDDLGLTINKKTGDFINNPDIVNEKSFQFDLKNYIYDKQDYVEFVEEICNQ